MAPLRNLKVKPKSLSQAAPCAPELAAMLACWAASGDRLNREKCASSAVALQECMASGAMKGRVKVRKPTINYREFRSLALSIRRAEWD